MVSLRIAILSSIWKRGLVHPALLALAHTELNVINLNLIAVGLIILLVHFLVGADIKVLENFTVAPPPRLRRHLCIFLVLKLEQLRHYLPNIDSGVLGRFLIDIVKISLLMIHCWSVKRISKLLIEFVGISNKLVKD